MFSINPLIYSKLTYDPKKDFVPVALVARAPLFLALHPKVPANDFKGFLDYVKANPGKVNYGSSGIGSTHHLTVEAMKASLGLDMVHVPFKGTGQSVPALVGGQVEMLFSAYPSLVGFVKDGRVKLIATNAAQRSSLAPDLPAISELVPGFDFAPIVGVLAPAGTPTRHHPEARRRNRRCHQAAGGRAADGTRRASTRSAPGPDDYAKAIANENARMAPAIKAAGMKQE